MKCSSIFIILLLAFAAAQFSSFGTFNAGSDVTVAPSIIGSKSVTLCSLVTYRFSPAPSGATFSLKSTNIQAGTTKYFYSLPSQVNFFWGPSSSDMGVYVMQAQVDNNGVKSSYGTPITVKVGPRIAGTGSDCPYELKTIVSSFTRRMFSATSTPSVSIPTYGFSEGYDDEKIGSSLSIPAKSSAPVATATRFGFKSDEEKYNLVYSGVLAIGLGFLLVAFYSFGLKR